MFDEILQAVKDHVANNPELAAAIPADQADAIHNEIATHLSNTTQAASNAGGGGGLLGSLTSVLGGGGTMTNAIEGGLVNTLASKFGLPPEVTGAISGALPGILQKFAAGNNNA